MIACFGSRLRSALVAASCCFIPGVAAMPSRCGRGSWVKKMNLVLRELHQTRSPQEFCSDNLHIYDYLIPHLAARGRRVVAFDFLGFGESDKTAGATYTFGQQLGDLKAVVDALGLEKIIPMAHDSSGSAAINFAIDYPEHTASLVILNAVFAQAPTLKLPELIELLATTNLKALTSKLLRSPDQFGWVVDFQRNRFQARQAQGAVQRVPRACDRQELQGRRCLCFRADDRAFCSRTLPGIRRASRRRKRSTFRSS